MCVLHWTRYQSISSLSISLSASNVCLCLYASDTCLCLWLMYMSANYVSLRMMYIDFYVCLCVRVMYVYTYVRKSCLSMSVFPIFVYLCLLVIDVYICGQINLYLSATYKAYVYICESNKSIYVCKLYKPRFIFASHAHQLSLLQSLSLVVEWKKSPRNWKENNSVQVVRWQIHLKWLH